MTTPERNGTTQLPPCADECRAVLQQQWEIACERSGVPPIEAIISPLAPLVKSGYQELAMVCPHGVAWHMEPTTEQLADWARDGVE